MYVQNIRVFWPFKSTMANKELALYFCGSSIFVRRRETRENSYEIESEHESESFINYIFVIKFRAAQ